MRQGQSGERARVARAGVSLLLLAVVAAPTACGQWSGKPDDRPARDTDPVPDTDTDTAPPDTDTDTGPPDSGDSGDSGETGEPPVREEALVFAGDRPRNLLVISIDTLRRGDVSRYSGGDTTPFIDGLAAQGVALDDHTSCSSWTLPGIVCALGGRNPEELGFVPHIEGETLNVDIPEGTELLPTWLGEHGYRSWLVASNDYFREADGAGTGARYDSAMVRAGLPADGVAERAFGILDTPEFGGASNWFLHLHFIDPHAPYNPPARYLTELDGRPVLTYDLATEEGTRNLARDWAGMSDEQRTEARTQLQIRYDGELQFVDDQIELIWAELESRGLLEDTLVLFWSDHGEQFFEQGSLGHAGDLYAPTTDALAFFWARNLAPVTWTEPTSHPDLAPTVLSALGLPAEPQITGAAIGLADPSRPRFHVVWPPTSPPIQAVQVGSFRLVYEWSGVKRLFSRGQSPRESGVTYDPEGAQVEALWDVLMPEVERLQTIIPDETPVDPGP